MEEIWKQIHGFENYEASNLGQIRSRRSRHVLRPHTNSEGYAKVILFPGTGEHGQKPAGKCVSVHRAMWLAFFGPIPVGHEVDHIDNGRTNRLDNLQLLTSVENKKKQWDALRATGRKTYRRKVSA